MPGSGNFENMTESDLKDLIQKYRNRGNGQRADRLEQALKDQKNDGYSGNRAATRALAQVQRRDLEDRKKAAKKRGDKGKVDKIQSTIGRHLKQYQKGSRYNIEKESTGNGGGNRFGKKVKGAKCPNCGHTDVSYTGYYYICEKCLYKSQNATEWFPDNTNGGGNGGRAPHYDSWYQRHDLFQQIIKGILIWFIITAIGWVVSNLVWHGIIGNFYWFLIGGFCIGFSVMDFAPENVFFQVTRAGMRGIGIYFVGMSAWVVYPLAGLLVTFFGYLTLPAEVASDLHYESTLAGVRFMLGILLTFFVYNMIGGSFLIKWGLTLIVGGFFATLPEITPGQVGNSRVGSALNVVVNAGGGEEQMGSRLISVMACASGTALGLLHFGLNNPAPFPMATFGMFGLVAVVTAYSTPSSVRGMAGMPYVLVIFFVTGLIFPGVIGEAFFGAWWPTIHENMQDTFGPLSDSMSSSLQNFKFGFNCLLDPVGCARKWEPGSTTEKGVYAVDINKIEPLIEEVRTYPSENNPKSVETMIEIENKGARTSENIKLQLLEPILPEIGKVGKPKEMSCNGKMISATKNCTIDKLYPGETKQISATYEITGGDKLEQGDFIKLPAKISYVYSANATLDVELWDDDYYKEMHLKDQVNPQYVQSKDTGGVVGVGLSAGIKQPVRDTMPRVPIFVSLQNRGNGYIPKGGLETVQVDIDGLGNLTNSNSRKNDKICNLGEEYENLEEFLPIEEEDSAKDVCTIDIVDIPGPNVTKRTFGINGYVKYKYEVKNQGKVKLAFSAVKCVCKKGDEPEEKWSEREQPTVYDPCQCEEACKELGYNVSWKKSEGKCVR
ncbi:MAG: hypothetical protein ABEK36_02115 [Candidatus Aenigmatarchaeota archaeon]